MKNHIIFKFIAILLSAAALFAVAVGTVGVVAFADIGLYSDSLKNVQNRQMATDMLALAERIAIYYDTERQTRKPPQAFLDSYFENYDLENEIRYPHEGMWYYEIIDYNTGESLKISTGAQGVGEATLYNEYMVQSQYPVICDILDESEAVPTEAPLPPDEEKVEPRYPQGWYQYTFSQTGGEDQVFILVNEDGPIYKVRLYLLPGAYEQQVEFLWELLDLAYNNRYLPMAMLAIGALALAVCLTFLCTTAGKKPGSQRIKAAALNGLPLDIYLAACVVAVWALISGYIGVIKTQFVRESAPAIINSIALTGYLGCVLVVGFCFALAAQTRMEGGVWWRRSALYNLFKLLCLVGKTAAKLCRIASKSIRRTWSRFLDVLPHTWQWLLWCLALVAVVIAAALLHIWWVWVLAAVIVLASVYYMLHAYNQLLSGVRRMSTGDLNTPVDTEQLLGGFREFGGHLNALADVAVVAAQKQMRSERMRAELITNVSHDIKTPLTSIISYVDLLKSTDDPEAEREYLEVLSRQSGRMKKLIEDLIELSKATTGNMPVDFVRGDAAEYLQQALGEFSDKLEGAALTPIFEAPDHPVPILCDGRLTWRVLSNLLSNAVKYALPGTRLYANVTEGEGKVCISLKNISRQQLNVSSDELMERFVRGDTARNTEGSGLGLNIAKSLMELQKGALVLTVDGDLFKATLVFPAVAEETQERS